MNTAGKPKSLIPSPVTGYELEPVRGNFSIIKAEETVNLVKNPSFELGSTYYSALGTGGISTNTVKQRRGVFSLEVVAPAADDGVRYSSVNADAGQKIAFSADVYGVVSYSYRLNIVQSSTGTIIASRRFDGKNFWTREYVVASAPTNEQYYLEIRAMNGGSTFYTDGWQAEYKGYVTTYCDGDMIGLVRGQRSYYWNGKAHDSTSTRISGTRHGGRLVSLKSLSFQVTGHVGLGMPPVSNITTELSIGGSFYQKTLYRERTFSLIGSLFGNSIRDLHRKRNNLIQALRFDTTDNIQPMVLRYQPVNDSNELTGIEYDIVCLYESGAEGSINNHYQETLELRFKMAQPYITERHDTGLDLNAHEIFTDTNFVWRDHTYHWYQFGDGVRSGGGEGSVRQFYEDRNKYVYMAGGFDEIDGVAVNNICYWDGESIQPMGTGANNIVNCVTGDQDGAIYIGGLFTSVDGVACNGIAKWKDGQWYPVDSGIDVGGIDSHQVYAIAISHDGNLIFVGGLFSTMNGVSCTNLSYGFNGEWFPYNTDDEVRALYFDDNSDTFFVGGRFHTINSQSTLLVAGIKVTKILPLYLELTLDTLLGGLNSDKPSTTEFNYVRFIAPMYDGFVVFGGRFTATASGLTGLQSVVTWDYSKWLEPEQYSDLEVGDVIDVGSAYSIAKHGVITWFTALNSVPSDPYHYLSSSINRLCSKGQWLPSIECKDVARIPPDDYWYHAFPTIGRIFMQGEISNYISPNVYVINESAYISYPTLVLIGPMSLVEIRNSSTDTLLSFKTLVIASGEIITLNTDPNNFFIKSSTRGDISAGLRFDSTVDFFLKTGENRLSLYATDRSKLVNIEGNPGGFSFVFYNVSLSTSDFGYQYVSYDNGTDTFLIYKDSAKLSQVGVATYDSFDTVWYKYNISEVGGSGMLGTIMVKAKPNPATFDATIRCGLAFIKWKRSHLTIDTASEVLNG